MDLKAGDTKQAKQLRTEPAAELRLVPPWAWALAVTGFLCAQYYFNFVLAQQTDAPATWVRALMGAMAGLVLSCYLLFLGYVNRDARRREMSPTLWTLVALLIPNGLGILLYFILRRPVPGSISRAEDVGPGSSACPRCGYQLQFSCSKCNATIGRSDAYCRTCGASLHSQTAPLI